MMDEGQEKREDCVFNSSRQESTEERRTKGSLLERKGERLVLEINFPTTSLFIAVTFCVALLQRVNWLQGCHLPRDVVLSRNVTEGRD
jgi:hypothetical protein